jgi:hypothetical protein
VRWIEFEIGCWSFPGAWLLGFKISGRDRIVLQQRSQITNENFTKTKRRAG